MIDSGGRPAFEYCLQAFSPAHLALSVCKENQQRENPRVLPFTPVFGGVLPTARSDRTARKLQQAGGKQSDGSRGITEATTLVKC